MTIHTKTSLVFILVSGLLLAILSGCSSTPTEAPVIPTSTVGVQATEPSYPYPQATDPIPTMESGAYPQPQATSPSYNPYPEPSITLEPVEEWTPVELPQAGIALQVSANWEPVEGEPDTWSPEPGSPVRLGLRAVELQPGQMIEAALLPQGSVNLDMQPIPLSIGNGNRFTVQVFDPSAQGGVKAVEYHLLFKGSGTSGIDLFLSAPNQGDLVLMDDMFFQIASSIRLLE